MYVLPEEVIAHIFAFLPDNLLLSLAENRASARFVPSIYKDVLLLRQLFLSASIDRVIRLWLKPYCATGDVKEDSIVKPSFTALIDAAHIPPVVVHSGKTEIVFFEQAGFVSVKHTKIKELIRIVKSEEMFAWNSVLLFVLQYSKGSFDADTKSYVVSEWSAGIRFPQIKFHWSPTDPVIRTKIHREEDEIAMDMFNFD